MHSVSISGDGGNVGKAEAGAEEIEVTTTTPLEIRLPIRTVSETNQREHFMAKYRRGKHQRLAVFCELHNHRAKHKFQLPLRVTFIRIAPRRLDEGDNLPASFKACRDEVASFFNVNDGSPRWTWCYDQKRGEVGEYGVVIRIEAREVSA